MSLDKTLFKSHLAGLVAQAASPVFISASRFPRFIIAYSGGLDSHVLLHLVHACQYNCVAVYIDHGLQADSAAWAEHCRMVCRNLKVPFQAIKVDALPQKGDSPEASARGARYNALADLMEAGDVLLTAQHLQDQAETLILQMLRTAGPAGLSAMPAIKPFSKGLHIRPLLETERAEIEAYALENGLKWIDDPSNDQQRYDRNYLRHSIIPLMQQRWPSVNRTLSNVAGLQAEAFELMNDMASLDAVQVIEGQQIVISELLKLSPSRQRNMIRFWLQQLQLDIPTSKRLQEIMGPVLSARGDKNPFVSWSRTEVRRFQGRLYGMPSLNELEPGLKIGWDGNAPLELLPVEKEVCLVSAPGGLSASVLGQPMTIRFRQGGERIKPAGKAHTADLKKLMQQASIPPWERNRIPLLYLDEQLIAVADYWVADGFKNEENQPGWQLLSRFVRNVSY